MEQPIILTKTQKENMLHALGLDYKKKAYRNFYCTYGEDESWNELVSFGFATKRPFPKGFLPDNGIYYFVTEKGAKFLGVKLPSIK